MHKPFKVGKKSDMLKGIPWLEGQARIGAILLVTLGAGVAGILTLTAGRAQVPTVSIQAESGSVSNASVVADTTASQGKAIKFSDGRNFITASGMNFMYKGTVFRWLGFNAYGMSGCYNGSPWTTTQLDAYFSKLPAHGVTRTWAFKSYGTATIATILTEAAKYKQHLILTLGDDDAYCGESDGALGGQGSGKTLAFYQTGWKGAYLTWVNTIVPMFKDNQSIMMWEVANEPGMFGAQPSLTDMQAYLKGTSDAVRAKDPNHLIGVGANYPGNFGGQSNYNTLMGLPNIDTVSFHDYSYEYEKGAIVSGNFGAAKQAAQLNNKPFYAGEAGVPAGPTCADIQYTQLSTTSRLNFLKAKADNYFANGIGGMTYWEYEPFRASWVGDCANEMYPTDPMVTMVQNYPIP